MRASAESRRPHEARCGRPRKHEGRNTVSDVVVTVPKNFRYGGKRGLAAWLDEGDAPGEPWSGEYYEYSTWGWCPQITSGERVYVACEGRIVGYAPLVSVIFD